MVCWASLSPERISEVSLRILLKFIFDPITALAINMMRTHKRDGAMERRYTDAAKNWMTVTTTSGILEQTRSDRTLTSSSSLLTVSPDLKASFPFQREASTCENNPRRISFWVLVTL